MKKETRKNWILTILLIICFSTKIVKAETYPIENYNTRLRFMPNDTYINNVNWNQNYWNGTPYDNYKGFDVKANVLTNAGLLYEGRYLISFLVWSNHYDPNELYCGHLTSNFKNVDRITGNWVQNQIRSSCVDVYHVTYLGKPAWRLLYEFTYNGGTYGQDGINELEFIVNSERNFFNGDNNGLDAGITVSDILDYDLNVINTWNTDKSQQTIINGQQEIINNQTNNTNSIIYNQNNNTQDIINSQEELNQDLIDNQNENTQDIIDNQNQNTQDMIDSQVACYKQIITKNNIVIHNKYLNQYGSVTDSNSGRGITDYIDIEHAKYIKPLSDEDSSASLCFYDLNKTKISCIQSRNLNINTNLTIPDKSKYVRFTINENLDIPNFEIEICKNGNQALMDADIDEESKEMPDDSSWEDYVTQEETLKDIMEQADLTNLNIGIDGTTSNFIWETITTIVNTHSLIFNMFISILSIGVLKMALGR